MASRDWIEKVAQILWAQVYEASFRGKKRGRFCLTREQMRKALRVERLHSTTIERLQDVALSKGLVIIDLDDLFPCVEVDVLRRYRRPPGDIFDQFFPPFADGGGGAGGDGDADEDDDDPDEG